MLRTIFVATLMLIGVRYSLKGAFYTLLFYLWIAYFRPDYWIYTDWVTQLNLSFLVGAAVVISTLMSGERLRFGFAQMLMVLFLVHSLISAMNCPVLAGFSPWPTWTDFARKVTVGLLMVILVTTEERLRMVFVIICVSLAFEGAKQGWFQLVTNPGEPNTNPSPFLGDNNGVAVGMLMLVPVLTALAATSKWKLEKYICYFLVVGVLYRAISTYSRGGFLAMLGLGLHYLLRTKRKIRAILAVAIIVGIIYPVLPNAFWDRMGSIQTAANANDDTEMDASSAGRLHFWKVAVVLADAHPVLGIGFDSYNYQYDLYDFSNGAYGRLKAVHSAWFGMLAEMGYVGLTIFILLILNAFYVNFRARRLAKTRPDMKNLVIYGTALEGALVAFAVGGSFVPHQYNEMLWHFIALTVVLDRLVRDRMTSPIPVPVAAPLRVERASAFTGLPRPVATP